MQVLRQYRTFRSTPPPSHITNSTPLDLPEEHKPAPYVAFTPEDPSNPQNWSQAYKAWVIGQLTFLTLSLTFASSISSAASPGALSEFGKEGNTIGGVATTGAFVVGVGLGAMPFAPLSERMYQSSRVGADGSIRTTPGIYRYDPPRYIIRNRMCPSTQPSRINHIASIRRILLRRPTIKRRRIIK
jgi:hypothetical protein